MFEAPFHPKVVHLPIALSILMPLVAGGLLVAWVREWLPSRAWWGAVALQALLFAGSWVAMSTGETDEEKVEEVVPESAIEEHEHRAETFYWATGGVLALFVLPMVVPGGRRRRIGAAVVAVGGTIVVTWLGARVGEAGGALVYEHGAGQAHADASPGLTAEGEGSTADGEPADSEEHDD